MNTNKDTSKLQNTHNQPQSLDQCDQLKIGIDVHAAFFVVACQMDGSNPKPPQKLTPVDFLPWLGKQMKKAKTVVCCYEAGPTGFWLHRKIMALGAINYVVCPTRLDSRRKGVNTDKTDAKELLSRLDRYLAGNKAVFSIVRVPSEEEEKRRIQPRQREQLRRTRLSLASMGRSLLLLHSHRVSNQWWQPLAWQQLQPKLPEWLLNPLSVYREAILAVQRQLNLLTRTLKAKAPKERPKGMGQLSWEQLESEVCDWSRFKTRRQVGSYAGLTGGVSGSGEQLADLSITKAGNKRLRTTLIEMAWRILLYQHDYWLVKKWKSVLLNPRAHGRRKKRVIVAFARQLFVDLWKWRTGKATPQSLGWIMAPE